MELPFGWGSRHGKAQPSHMFDPSSARSTSTPVSSDLKSEKMDLPIGWGSRHNIAPPDPSFDPVSARPTPSSSAPNTAGEQVSSPSSSSETAPANTVPQKTQLPFGWGSRHSSAPPHPLFDPASAPISSAPGTAKDQTSSTTSSSETAPANRVPQKMQSSHGLQSRHRALATNNRLTKAKLKPQTPPTPYDGHGAVVSEKIQQSLQLLVRA